MELASQKRDSAVITETPDFNIQMKFRNGSSAQLAIGPASETMIAGELVERRSLTLLFNGSPIIKSIYGTNHKGRHRDFAYRIEAPRSGDLNSKTSTPKLDVELHFDAPIQATVKMSIDGTIETAGEVDIEVGGKTKPRTTINRQNTSRDKPQAVPEDSTLITLEQYMLSETSFITRKNPDSPLRNHANTIVALWKHTPDMVSTVCESILPKIEERALKAGGTINTCVECVTDDNLSRARFDADIASSEITLGSTLFSANTDSLREISDAAAMYREIRKELNAFARHNSLRVQMRSVDVNQSSEEGAEYHRRQIAAHREIASLILQPKTSSFLEYKQSINDATYRNSLVEHSNLEEREKVVKKQLDKWGLSRRDNAVNVLMIGAAHEPIVDRLKGSQPVQAIINRDATLKEEYGILKSGGYQFLELKVRRFLNDSTKKPESALFIKHGLTQTVDLLVTAYCPEHASESTFIIDHSIQRRTLKECNELLKELYSLKNKSLGTRMRCLFKWLSGDEQGTTPRLAIKSLLNQYLGTPEEHGTKH